MLSFCRLSLYNNTRQPSSLPRLSWLTDRNPTPVVSRWLAPVYGHAFKRTSKDQSSFIVHAVEKDSQKYEIDSGKAKEALQKLDQQLQAFSDKQISSPKIRASDVKLTRDEVTEEVPRSFRVFPGIHSRSSLSFHDFLQHILPYSATAIRGRATT
ncbi:hypothetical protein OIU79_027745 [Salix purpurea]|uniref:Uncharacterized protein n=1 Tax=Salix purpurea TaxID=77065 RepID=A0A9Q1A253_SALPP|nr:hypothetical protein OIU79_027745 [Salix purpurea]